MSLFDEYYSEYTDLVNRAGSLNAELLETNPFSSEAHSALGGSIDEALSEATDVVKQMEIHGRSLKKPKNRFPCLSQVRVCVNDSFTTFRGVCRQGTYPRSCQRVSTDPSRAAWGVRSS